MVFYLSLSIDEEEQGLRHIEEKVQYSTFQKWKHEFDRECKTITWLECETIVEGSKVVRKLKCIVCAMYQLQIFCTRNYRIARADSACTNNIHAGADPGFTEGRG